MMNIFWKVLKIKPALTVYAPIVFNFYCLVMENIKENFLLASMKLLTNFEILPVTLFKLLVAACRKLPVILKIVP